MMDNVLLGLTVAFTPVNLAYCFIGVLVGTLVGVLPGIGPLATIAMLLPFTLGVDASTSMIMLAGIFYGSAYGSSTTAIMLNLPGDSSSAITTIDGYKMARRGQAGKALAAAGLSSFFAGTVATVLIALLATPLTAVALSFGPAEYFSLLTAGLISSIALASGSLPKALAMICLGLLLGLTGTDVYTGAYRFTFGSLDLVEGMSFIAITVGMFGISEIMRNLETSHEDLTAQTKVSGLWPTIDDLRRMFPAAVRGTAIGSLLGILPGGGATLSSFFAYSIEKRVSKNASEFGHGAIEGVASPEAANNAASQTSFIPMLSLGIPSNAVMALMIGALIMQGITPGPLVMTRNADLFWGLIISMWVGNAMLIILNLPLIGLWIRLLRVPYTALFPVIIAFCCIAVFSVNGSVVEVLLVAIFALLGHFLFKLRCELPPFLLGFILGQMLEEYLRRALIISKGDPSVFVTRPISAFFLAVAVIVLVVVSRPAIARRRKEVFVEEG